MVHLMARTESDIAAAKAEADERVRAINADLQERLGPQGLFLEAIQEAIETFASAHRKDFGGERSLALAHGRVGWRVSPPAVRFLRPAEEIIAGLKDRGLDVAIMTTERASKDVLATFPEDLLGELGVRITQRDDFYVEVAEARVSDAPPAAGKG
jgi:phage host-nuclease inhibitor protein Gam